MQDTNRVFFLNCEVVLQFVEYRKDLTADGAFLARYTQCRGVQDLYDLDELLCSGEVVICDPI